jgi:ABC-type polar amino acid transport system ATPase subunit
MIAVREISKRFGGLSVLDGVSLTVAPGEVAAIVGPSGSGKSTLLRCINGLDGFDSGEVEVGDCRIGPRLDARHDARLLQSVRRRVGFVFQQFNLFPHLSVLGNVIEAPVHVLGLRRDDAVARARKLLERVGLPHKLDAWPRQLSGGEQQRAAIARALAMEPEVMLFDEPTSALDPAMANEVMAVISDLARSGQTMVVVTHAIEFAISAAAVAYVLCQGKIVESGPAGEVLRRPRHGATRSFLSQAIDGSARESVERIG